MSKVIFNQFTPYFKKYIEDAAERRKEREKLTKKAIREYFKSHHIENNYRSYAEYFIIDYENKRLRDMINDYERREETYKKMNQENLGRIEELKSLIP